MRGFVWLKGRRSPAAFNGGNSSPSLFDSTPQAARWICSTAQTRTERGRCWHRACSGCAGPACGTPLADQSCAADNCIPRAAGQQRHAKFLRFDFLGDADDHKFFFAEN